MTERLWCPWRGHRWDFAYQQAEFARIAETAPGGLFLRAVEIPAVEWTTHRCPCCDLLRASAWSSRMGMGALISGWWPVGGDQEAFHPRRRGAECSAGRGTGGMRATMNRILERGMEWLFTPGLRVVLIAAALFAALWLLRATTRRLRALLEGVAPSLEEAKRAAALTHIVRDVAMILVVAVGAMMVLAELGVDLKPILAAAGIGGLAIGFGAQSLVKDVITGFFLLLENQVRAGDVVSFGGTGGPVEAITLRTIILRDLDGNVHIIPHGAVDRVTNMTKDYSRYVFDVGIASREPR